MKSTQTLLGVLAAALTIGAVSARCPLVGTYCGAGGATCCLQMVCVYDRGRNRCHHNCEGNAGDWCPRGQKCYLGPHGEPLCQDCLRNRVPCTVDSDCCVGTCSGGRCQK
ncbi:uncharacterized protein MYCGRDRAFT_106260 [Zymoseptoria tritici IPO323]|uniref:AvrStb6 n=1 Tax=Zymoseptoria tritici (strain CBS 115943 / IPO323) TaxID=336722 RepID=F9XPF6_ZYMTI|nr:uncharacterized protein MYCGRDRAFT_106260 [Zymoseptoria tritici IPO323]EGP82834.1 hypothetical protein MYCGRDRAFT_106260 [Zymoseptoria tritici IPO323]